MAAHVLSAKTATPPSDWYPTGGLNPSIEAVCLTPKTANAALSSNDFTVLPKTGGCATLA